MKFGNYDKVNSQGVIPENTPICNGDVIIAKVFPIKENRNDPSKVIKYEDMSRVYRTHEECFVDKNYIARNGDGYNFCKVRIRTHRKPVIGDKFSSRHGQKGTISNIIPECDIPYMSNGMKPDIIINPHAIPSRMTIGQLKETLLGKVLLELGLFGDGTSFGGLDVKGICKELSKLGFEPHGNELLYSGLTGEQLETSVFIGPAFYQRLKHMVNDKQHSRSFGPTVSLTRQPAEGGREMEGTDLERWSVIVWSATELLSSLASVSTTHRIHSAFTYVRSVEASRLTIMGKCHDTRWSKTSKSQMQDVRQYYRLLIRGTAICLQTIVQRTDNNEYCTAYYDIDGRSGSNAQSRRIKKQYIFISSYSILAIQMSGFNIDMNPSLLGGGAPGNALQLLGGGGGSSGGSGMVGGSARGRNRFALRNAFKTNRIGPYYKFCHYAFTRQENPNGAIAGVIQDGVTITPTTPGLPMTLSAPFYNANGEVILTYPGQLINTTTPAVIDLTQSLTIYANNPTPPPPDTLFIKGKTSTGQDVVFLDGASVELFNDRQVAGLRALCGPFRAAMSAGDVLGRKNQSAVVPIW